MAHPGRRGVIRGLHRDLVSLLELWREHTDRHTCAHTNANQHTCTQCVFECFPVRLVVKALD